MLNCPFTGEPSSAFTLFAMECEGELDTQVSKRNKLIKDLRELATWSPVSEADVREKAIMAGFPILTDEEVRDIMYEIFH